MGGRRGEEFPHHWSNLVTGRFACRTRNPGVIGHRHRDRVPEQGEDGASEAASRADAGSRAADSHPKAEL